jgi:hypothetical protein
MVCVGTLTAPRRDQTQPDQPAQQHLEGHVLQVMGNQPGPELRPR